jgi:hypothetical protein
MIKINRRWKFFLISAPFVIAAYIYAGSVVVISNSEAYRAAEEYVLSDSSIHQSFGKIESLGWPTGNLNSPTGHSLFRIKVVGEKNSQKIAIKLVNSRYGVWKVISWEPL